MPTRPFFFKLVESKPVPCSWYEATILLSDYRDRALAYTVTPNGYKVSTSFLVFDHNAFGDSPVLWNTIVTAPDGRERLMGRYASEGDARDGHDQVLALLRLVG